MKYLVMECHDSYAVLMDENSAFVTAANLHYSVGQTVTEPVIMSDTHTEKRRNAIVLTRFIAAAACLVLLVGGSYTYYSYNYKTYSTVVISSDASVRMSLNKRGKVIKLESIDESGKKLLEGYDGKGKDQVTVANELLERGLSNGMISSGDTVEFFIESEKKSNYDELKSEIESEIPKLNVNVSVQEMEEYPKSVTKKPDTPTQPASEPAAPEITPPATAGSNKPLPPVPEKPVTDKNAPNADNNSKPQPPAKPDPPPTPNDISRDNGGPAVVPDPPAVPDAPPAPEHKEDQLPHEKEAAPGKPDEALPHLNNIVPDEEGDTLIHHLPVLHAPLIRSPGKDDEPIPETPETPEPPEAPKPDEITPLIPDIP